MEESKYSEPKLSDGTLELAFELNIVDEPPRLDKVAEFMTFRQDSLSHRHQNIAHRK